jgi:hypothetical protein
MALQRLGQRLAGARASLVGAVLVVVLSVLSAVASAKLATAVVAVLLVFIVFLIGFVVVPHRAIAAMILLFAFIPMLKDFVNPSVGGLKDVVDFAAVFAAAIHVAGARRRMDRWTASLVGILLVLYLVDLGRPHGADWVEGMRLTGEPLLLLLVGFLLPDPRRNLRWALGALVVAGFLNALYGIVQQVLGPAELVSLGYSYGVQVRTIGSSLRSFGTIDDPFAYAALLYFSLVATYFLLRRGWWLWFVEFVLVLGLLASTVRTALLVLLGFVALGAVHKELKFPAACLGIACAVIGVITLAQSSGIQTQTFNVYYTHGGYTAESRPVADPSGVVLNGRVSAWTAAVGSRPIDWFFGRGVGQVGTATQRASAGVLSATSDTTSGDSAQTPTASAVDDGYLATVADVGIVGLLVELALFARLIYLGAEALGRGKFDGWLPLGLLTAMLLDALTRASFTGFPTAFIGFLVIGIATASLNDGAVDLESQTYRPGRESPMPTLGLSSSSR